MTVSARLEKIEFDEGVNATFIGYKASKEYHQSRVELALPDIWNINSDTDWSGFYVGQTIEVAEGYLPDYSTWGESGVFLNAIYLDRNIAENFPITERPLEYVILEGEELSDPQKSKDEKYAYVVNALLNDLNIDVPHGPLIHNLGLMGYIYKGPLVTDESETQIEIIVPHTITQYGALSARTDTIYEFLNYEIVASRVMSPNNLTADQELVTPSPIDPSIIVTIGSETYYPWKDEL